MMTLIRGDALDSQIPARTYIRRCARFGDRTVPFLVRSGDRTVLFLVLYPLQGCTICRLVSLARPRRLAEPDLVQNSIW